MNTTDRGVLVSQWCETLTEQKYLIGSACDRERLAGFVDDLAAILEAEPFEPDRGERVGAALAEAGLVVAGAPNTAGRVLYRLAAASPRGDARRRGMQILSAVVRGHRDACRNRADMPATADSDLVAATGKLFRVALDHSTVAVVIGEIDGALRYVNRANAELLGVPVDSLTSATVFDFVHPDDVDHAIAVFFEQVAERSGTVRLETRLVRGDGTVRHTSFAVTYVRGSAGQPDTFVAVGEDVTEQHALQQQLHWQAHHDPLTGLPNRRELEEQVETIGATAPIGEHIGLCFADLDNFKNINDLYGHTVGDRVLCEVADRFRGVPADRIRTVARIGGDEFVVLLAPPADDRTAVSVAEELLNALAEPIAIDGHRLPVSLSVGVMVAEAAGIHADTVLDAADRGLHRAKLGGRHRWAFQSFDSSPGADLVD